MKAKENKKNPPFCCLKCETSCVLGSWLNNRCQLTDYRTVWMRWCVYFYYFTKCRVSRNLLQQYPRCQFHKFTNQKMSISTKQKNRLLQQWVRIAFCFAIFLFVTLTKFVPLHQFITAHNKIFWLSMSGCRSICSRFHLIFKRPNFLAAQMCGVWRMCMYLLALQWMG